MPHRDLLLDLLRRYEAGHPDQRERVGFVRDFVTRHEDCFERSCREGHVTGSAWILSPDHRSVLLTRHRKLGRWLQLGGHADGNPDVASVALREAREDYADVHYNLARTLDAGAKVLAAEVVFVLREEFARTLADIVFRRMMVGLDADQGRPMYAAIADIAAREHDWDEQEKANQVRGLVAYADSWRVG